jgi:transposase
MPEVTVESWVGIDWGHEFHQVCHISNGGPRERRFAQSAAGLAELVTWLREQAGDSLPTMQIAIERPHGPVVETLLLNDFAVFAINPKQLDRFRDRHTVAGAKDDRRDALVLADSLRTDPAAFTGLQLVDAKLVQLRELVRMDEHLRNEEVALSHRLRDLLRRYFPAMHSLMADRADPLLWSLLELADTPATAARLSQDQIQVLIQSALQTPSMTVTEGTVVAASAHVQLLLPRLQLLHKQRRQCGKSIDRILDVLITSPSSGDCRSPSDAQILHSLPGVGRSVLAIVLVEAASQLARRDLPGLRSLGGIAPVTRRSGKQNVRIMRRACNARLRYAFYHWGRTAVQRDPVTKLHYAELRGKGHSHGRALRGAVDRLLSVATAMLKDGTLYDPKRRQRGRAVVAHA